MNKSQVAGPADRYLLHRLNHGDEIAFNILYQNYWHPLLNFAGKYISDNDTRKEMVQELFISLHIKGPQLKISVSLSAYLFCALRNKILNHRRNQSVYNRHLRIAAATSWSECSDNDVEQFINHAELKAELNNWIGRMPPKCRDVYVLHEQNYYTLKKTSEILHRPLDTVEKQFRRALHFLRDHLVV